MKNLLFALILLPLLAIGSVDNRTPLRLGLYSNMEALPYFSVASPSVTYVTDSVSASVDPFWAKTNKYAESKIVRVICASKGCHINFGSSGVSAPSTSTSYYIAPNVPEYFLVDEAYPYIRVIQNDASAVLYVTEIY